MRTGNWAIETTTSIAGTSGDGDVTCSAYTPASAGQAPRLSDVLGSGTTQIRYDMVKKSNLSLREEGIGTYNGSTNVLKRIKILQTWSGSSLVNTGTVTALQFGSTPTSGDVLITLSPMAAQAYPLIEGVQTLFTNDATWGPYPISQSLIWNNSGSGFTVTANREYYCFYELKQAGVLKGVQVEVVTGSAGNMKWALYSVDQTGLPSQKILDFTTITTMASTGTKTDTAFTNIWLPAGWYAFGMIFDSTPAMRSFSGSNGSWVSQLTPAGRTGGYGYGMVYFVGGSYSTGLPATPALSGGTLLTPSQCIFWNGMKVQQ